MTEIGVLQKRFAEIGARFTVRQVPLTGRSRESYTLDVLRDRRGEHFDLRVVGSMPDLRVLNVEREQRHLLLFGRAVEVPEREVTVIGNRAGRWTRTTAERFLCGHDERHWFVAGVEGRVSTVREAKASLLPRALRGRVTGLEPRHNKHYTRQGEWFFVPAVLPAQVDGWRITIHRDEPITRGRGKPHLCEELVRYGGTPVLLHGSREITEVEYAVLVAKGKGHGIQRMMRDAEVYVRGKIRHDDHATLDLKTWHRVYLNTEFTSGRVAFYD